MEEDGFVEVSHLLHCAVYALMQRGEIVYIGQSKKPLTRLYSHANARGKLEPWKAGYNSRKAGFQFSGIWVRPCMLAELDSVEAKMIRKYQPKYNTKGRQPVAEMPASIRAMINELSAKAAPVGSQIINRRGL